MREYSYTLYIYDTYDYVELKLFRTSEIICAVLRMFRRCRKRGLVLLA